MVNSNHISVYEPRYTLQLNLVYFADDLMRFFLKNTPIRDIVEKKESGDFLGFWGLEEVVKMLTWATNVKLLFSFEYNEGSQIKSKNGAPI